MSGCGEAPGKGDKDAVRPQLFFAEWMAEDVRLTRWRVGCRLVKDAEQRCLRTGEEERCFCQEALAEKGVQSYHAVFVTLVRVRVRVVEAMDVGRGSPRPLQSCYAFLAARRVRAHTCQPARFDKPTPMSDMHGAVPQLQDYLEHSARRLPDKVALVCGQKRLTYREIDRRANALARTPGRARRRRAAIA